MIKRKSSYLVSSDTREKETEREEEKEERAMSRGIGSSVSRGLPAAWGVAGGRHRLALPAWLYSPFLPSPGGPGDLLLLPKEKRRGGRVARDCHSVMDDSTPTRSIRLHARTCLGGEAYPRAALWNRAESSRCPERQDDAFLASGRAIREGSVLINALAFLDSARSSGERGETRVHQQACCFIARWRTCLCFFTLLRTTNSGRNPELISIGKMFTTLLIVTCIRITASTSPESVIDIITRAWTSDSARHARLIKAERPRRAMPRAIKLQAKIKTTFLPASSFIVAWTATKFIGEPLKMLTTTSIFRPDACTLSLSLLVSSNLHGNFNHRYRKLQYTRSHEPGARASRALLA